MAVIPKGSDPSGKSWLPSLIGGALGIGGSVASFVLNKHETDTAHQREVKDLVKAGLNPMLSAGGRGSESAAPPSLSDSGERGVAAALAVRQAQASIELTRAQAERERASASWIGTQQTDLLEQARAGRYSVIRSAAAKGMIDSIQAEKMLPILLERARAEVKATISSAKRTDVLRALDEAALPGALNLAKLEKTLGAGGPAARAALEVIRVLRKPR